MECAQALLTADLDCKANLAPHPTDINWTRLSMPKSESKIRTVLVYTLLAVLFLFWSIPITFIQAFSSLGKIVEFRVTWKILYGKRRCLHLLGK